MATLAATESLAQAVIYPGQVYLTSKKLFSDSQTFRSHLICLGKRVAWRQFHCTHLALLITSSLSQARSPNQTERRP